ncbi:hypothetical protein D3C85_1521380 [compost metagenome]
MHFIDREVQLLDDVQHFPADIAGGANDGDAIAHDENILVRALGRKAVLHLGLSQARSNRFSPNWRFGRHETASPFLIRPLGLCP